MRPHCPVFIAKLPLPLELSGCHLAHGSLNPRNPYPNGISIGSAVSAVLTVVTNKHTDTQTDTQSDALTAQATSVASYPTCSSTAWFIKIIMVSTALDCYILVSTVCWWYALIIFKTLLTAYLMLYKPKLKNGKNKNNYEKHVLGYTFKSGDWQM